MRCAKGKPSWIICLFFALGGTTLRQLDIYSELQQLHLPLDGISVANTASVAKSNLTAYFPGGAITKYDAPNRQGSTKALAFQKDHHGYLEGAYPWLYDLEKSPTGITILLYFKVSVSPRGSVYLLAVGNREIDPSNAAGWDIHVNSATRKVEVRFGYRTYDFRCECGNINVNRWYSVHASCRNYFGFLQYSVAVNGVPCGQEQEDKCRVVEKTPNYDPIGIDRMYIATLTPATENNAEITLDEIRIYNTWIEINSPSLPTNETITPTDEFSDVDAEAITEAQADDHYIMDSALEGDPDICCIGTGNVTGCKAFCKDPHKSKLVQQINQEFAIMHTCAAKDFCSLQPCSDSCIQDPSGYSCQCRPGYFLDADNSSCVNHCDGVFCQINTKCVPTNIPPKYFKCVCDAGHTGDFCEIEKSMCLPNPCLHGSCVSGGLNGFTCICQPDYIGDLCEEEVLDCSRYPCRHEGTCVAEDSEKGFRCECKDGYNGDVCEKASDACTFVQCSNGGRCQIVNGSPMCVCATDFNDTKCEMSNTPCQPNPCNHGGTCEQDGRQFSCICPPGFKKGGRCEEDIDECLRDKLANTTTCAGNATCENTIGSFICQCPAGYALPDCLTPIDLCSSSPCLNGATCNPVPLSYTCTCAPGYVGQHCDIKGADRCTVTASEVRIIAGRYVTYVLQCASLGDKARFYFNMGDRFYFDATEPVYTPAASDAIRARTRIEVTLQTPSERYLYYYKHWFNGPGDYALTVQVYNGEFPTAKYITVVHVDPYPDICFPTVSIINGGWNISSGPPFHRSQYFVIQSSVTKPFFNTKCKQYIFVYEWTMYKLTVDHPIPELTEDWTGPRKSNEVTHDDAIKDIKKNDKFMAFPANTFMYGLYMDMLKVTATSNETIQSFTDAAENFTDISPFITTIVTNIQDLMANLTLAMADVEKEAESPNPTEDLVFASQMLNDSLKSMNESVANLTDIQALLPNASAALTEAANAKVDSVKPNRIVTTKAPLPPDPNSTIPIVPPKSTAEIATDALKLVERMAVVVNTTIKAIDNASMAIATVMTLMGAVPPSIKTAELNVSRAMHQFDRHLWNMTDKLDTVRRGKTAIDSDLINVDRGWFNITATPIKLEIKGGTKRIVSKTDSIVLDASNPQFSWDPDDSTPAENQTLTYYWFGTPVDGAFPERYFPQPPISVETLVSSSCQYPSCSGFIPDSKGQKTYTIPGPLKEGVYFFSVTVEVQRNMEGRTPTVLTPCIGTATQMVTVVADGFPSVEINCLKSNCAARIDAGERFALEGTCEHCDGATFLWEVLSTSDEDFDQFIWTNDSTNHSRVEFNKTWPIFAVLPNNFPLEAPEALYRFKFTVTMPDNKTSTTAEYSARINEPPSGGICIVDPTEGYELETLFDVECRGFIDKDHDLPLMYRFHYHNGEEKVVAPNDTAEMEGTLLYYNIDPYLPATVLSRGNPKRNYSAEIYIGVYDALGSVQVTKLDIKVQPQAKTAEELSRILKNLVSPGGLLSKNLDAKNDQGIAQAALVISRQLNNPLLDNFTVDSPEKKEKMKMRSTLVDALANVPVNSLGAVQQVAASLSQVVGDPHEIQNETQEASANILLDLADRLATDMRVDAGPQEMEETAGFMIRALTNLFDAIDHRRPKRPAIMYDGGPSPEPEDLGDEAKKAGINCVKSLNSVMKSYGATKIVGEDPTEFVSAEMLVGVQQQKAADVKSRIATGKMKEYLEIPDDMGSNLQGLNVQVQTMLSENNLYAWARSSADVTTPNVELSFADPKTQDAKPLKDLKQPIHVAFPLKQEVQEKGISGGGSISLEQWTLSMPARYYTSMNMTMQKITQVPENKSLVIQLNLRTSHNIKLSVLAAEKQPALESTTEAQAEDYQIGETVEGFEDHGQHEPKELYFVYPAAKRTTGTRTVYVTVVAGELTEYKDSTILKTVDNPPRNAVKNITYNFTAFAVACMYWEQSNEEWSTQGCTVSNRTTSKMIHCDCDHTSVFSAGMLVPPNKLEPIDPAELALMFFQNPLILITCAIIWVLYFVTLIYARRLDRKEEEKRGVHVLLDNDPNDTYFYVLTVSTGARPKAGTSAKVGIVLKGTHDQTEPHILNDVLDMKFFETGGEDSFLLATSDYLGELQTISIWHNGEGSRPSWFVDEVLVRDVQTNEVFFFLPDRWLSADKKDYQLSAEIPVSTHDDLTSTYHRFTTFTTSGIRDGHLWISIFFRPPRSPFTRAQRATCVLSLLLTTMLANIMFYGVPTNDPNQQRSFKGFEFNWNQIMLGIRSALVVLPVNLGVIYLFQNAKARHARGLDDVAEGDIPKPEEPPKQQVSITYLNPAMLNLFKFNRPIRKLFVRPLRIERIDNSPLIKHAEHNLPFWTKLVAWLVGLGTAIVSTILVVWFGLHFGRTKSQEWLASFFSALAMDVLFNQPLKVLLVSFLLAAVLRKPPPREHEGTVVSAFSEFRTGVKDIRNRLGYSPPSSEWVAAVRKMTFLTERMRTWLTDIGWFVLFMFSVFVFTYGNTPLGGSRVRTSLDSMFIGTNVLDSNDKEDGPFSKVKTVEMLWLYLESTFLVSYSPEKTARPQLLDKSVHFMVDEANLCLGPARMRQVRIRRENCSLDWRVVSFNMSCLPEYSTALHDTRSFLASWVLPEIATTKNNNGTNRTQSTTVSPDSEDKQDFVSDKNLDVQLHSNDTNNPWVYRNATELGIGHFMANLETYKGGGYVAVIPQQRTKAKERLAELRNSVWIDDLTRAIFLQMNTYNPSTNVFSIMFLVFEFHQSGLIIPFHRIDTIRLMYTDPMTPLDMAAIVFGICAVIFLCFLTVSLVKDISDTLFQRSWKYFRDPWNWLEVFIVSLGWGTVACYTHSQRNKMAAVKLILKAPQDHFVSFYFAVLTELAFLDMAALFLFVCSVKLLKIFRINRKVNSLFYVMNDARVPLVEYGISLLLAMTPFIIAGHVIFGRSLERHATFGASIVTLVRVMVADIDGLFEDYSGAERVLGPVFFLTAVVITIFLYTNAFVSLIMIVYEKTLEERKENIDRDAELADFVVERLKRLLGIRVEHPVIDFTKFPAAVALREMTAHPKNLDAKPKVVRPDEWTHFLEIAELRRLIQNVAQVIRGSGTTDIDASSLPESSFRTDYASHTNNWFFVHGVPTDDIDGPRSFPVDRITRANGMMEGLDGLREEEVVGMSDYNWDQLTIHQNLLADTRLAVDLAMNPEPPPPSPLSIPLPSLRVKKKKKAESDVRSSKSTPFLAKKSLRN